MNHLSQVAVLLTLFMVNKDVAVHFFVAPQMMHECRGVVHGELVRIAYLVGEKSRVSCVWGTRDACGSRGGRARTERCDRYRGRRVTFRSHTRTRGLASKFLFYWALCFLISGVSFHAEAGYVIGFRMVFRVLMVLAPLELHCYEIGGRLIFS